MQRVIRLLAQLRIGPHGQRHVGALDGNADVIKIIAVQQLYMAHSTFHQRLCRHAAVSGPQLLFQRAAVDADADGDIFQPADFRHCPDLLLPADVAGVDPQRIDPTLRAHQRQLIIEVDIRDQRNGNLLLDPVHRHGCGLIRHGHPDDFASGVRQSADLGNGCIHIVCFRIAHGLDRHRGAAAHGHPAHHQFLRHLSRLTLPI